MSSFPTNPNEKRRYECSQLLLKYPDRIPILIKLIQSKYSTAETELKLDRKQYLAPGDSTVSQFLYIIRKRCRLSEGDGLYLLINNQLIPGSQTLKQVYDVHKGIDGFLTVQICKEEIFGNSYHSFNIEKRCVTD